MRIYHQLDGELVVHDVGELGQQLERCQGHMGGVKFSNFKVNSGGSAFSQIEVLSEAIIPLLSTPCF